MIAVGKKTGKKILQLVLLNNLDQSSELGKFSQPFFPYVSSDVKICDRNETPFVFAESIETDKKQQIERKHDGKLEI